MVATMVVGALLVAPTARAQETWTEEDVIARAMAQAPSAIVARAEAALAEARVDASPRHPNPTFAFQRQQLVSDTDDYEMQIRASVPIELSGRRPVARHLSRVAAAVAAQNAALARTEAVTAAVLAYVDVLGAGRRVEVERAALEALDEAARVLARREESGTAAGYERVRLELEAELVRSALAQTEAELVASRALLRALVAPDLAALPTLDGSLAVREPGTLSAWQARARGHGAIEHTHRAIGAAAEAVDASGLAWLPKFTITGGAWGVGDNVAGRWGYVASLSMTIPLFTGDYGLPAVARAQRAASRTRAEALERRILADVAVAHAQLTAAHAEHARFLEATGPRVEVLTRGASSGYLEGLRTIVELLDAQRAAAAVRRRAVALEVLAKRAETRLRGAAGAWSADEGGESP